MPVNTQNEIYTKITSTYGILNQIRQTMPFVRQKKYRYLKQNQEENCDTPLITEPKNKQKCNT